MPGSGGANAGGVDDGKGPEAGDATTELWPALPLEAWQASFDTLHMWTQFVGKVKVRLRPPLNEWWHVAFPGVGARTENGEHPLR